MTDLLIRVREADLELLTSIADAEDRSPVEQAASFVHRALNQERARAGAGDRPATSARRGPRSVAA